MLLLIRGLPGSGKSTYARNCIGDKPNCVIIEADQYFMADGTYQFNRSKIPLAHKWCQEAAKRALLLNMSVYVCNTFTTGWEMDPYFQMAAKLNHDCKVTSLYDGGLSCNMLAERCIHGVPAEKILQMLERWQDIPGERRIW